MRGIITNRNPFQCTKDDPIGKMMLLFSVTTCYQSIAVIVIIIIIDIIIQIKLIEHFNTWSWFNCLCFRSKI